MTGCQTVFDSVRVVLPTQFGEFDVTAVEVRPGLVYLALARGDLTDGAPVLTRVHSECLTGDALTSLRCDCGIQLRMALRRIAAEGRGVVLYATGTRVAGSGCSTSCGPTSSRTKARTRSTRTCASGSRSTTAATPRPRASCASWVWCRCGC